MYKDKESDLRQLDEKWVSFHIGACSSLYTEAYGGFGSIKNGIVNVVLIVKFIYCR